VVMAELTAASPGRLPVGGCGAPGQCRWDSDDGGSAPRAASQPGVGPDRRRPHARCRRSHTGPLGNCAGRSAEPRAL